MKTINSMPPRYIPSGVRIVAKRRQPLKSRFTLDKIAKGAGTVIACAAVLAVFVSILLGLFDEAMASLGIL